MSIGTYAELVTALDGQGGYLHRGDVTALIPDWIKLAESRINRKLRVLLQETEATLTATIGSRQMAVPVLFIVPSIGYIAETCSLLTAVSELNLEVVHAVLVETEDVTILVNELRLKMLQRISSVETADVKKMDVSGTDCMCVWSG